VIKILVLMKKGLHLVLDMIGQWQEYHYSSNISFPHHQMTTLVMNGKVLENIQHHGLWLNFGSNSDHPQFWVKSISSSS